ncbi:MAG TPA: glycosyltransferase [Opitutaceae bacterium]|nr:glycosyltransferase [Opitutaceae bacterium]
MAPIPDARRRMKIAYIVQMAELDSENGVAKKLVMQIRAWTAAGHVVQLFSLARTTRLWAGFDGISTHVVPRGNPAQRIARSFRLATDVRQWRPDIIYFRYAYHSPGFPALFREVPAIAEINSDDATEYALTLSRAKQYYHRFTRGRILRAVRAFVPVTHELGQRVSAFGHPAEVIGNSIALDRFRTLAPPPSTAPVRVVFAGTAHTPWHGLDRLAELGRMFPEITFDVIGSTPADWEKNQAAPPPGNLQLHGVLPWDRYEPLLAAATAAVGTLAWYRNGMHEGSPLKVREYLAVGLPVLAAYRDVDVPDGADYFLRVPNDATSLAPHRDAVAAWLERWRGRRVPRAAIAQLDTAFKETQRLGFITRILAASRR